jgi:hypothetical protein
MEKMAYIPAQNLTVFEFSDESSDDTYTASLSEDDDSLDDEDIDWNWWRETPFKASTVKSTMDSVEPETINRYREEVTQIRVRLSSEVARIQSMYNTHGDPTINEIVPLTANKVFNCFFNPMVAFGLHGIMNK